MDVPEGERGLFFEEECYICDVLLEKVRQHSYIFLASKDKIHHCFFWIGVESTTDEYASAAILTTNLSDHLSNSTGRPTVHHREEQAHESRLFLSEFPQGI